MNRVVTEMQQKGAGLPPAGRPPTVRAMTSFSILDLAPIIEGGDARRALHNARDLARHAERWGYKRFWLAEHHSMRGIASAATSVAIAFVAGGTETIRVGAGGIMLPNHAPLIIAEQFGTLEALFPGRIDLGLGRAPGTDQAAAYAMRRNLASDTDRFPQDVVELMRYFEPAQPGQRVIAVPGEDSDIPVWILGSSLFGAQLAAILGLPFAFASHFAPQQMMEALEEYRTRFQPSARLAKPYVMMGYNIFAAATEDEARLLSTSIMQAFVNLRRGTPGKLQPPVKDYDRTLAPMERGILDMLTTCAAVGTVDQVREQAAAFVARTGADELMVTGQIFDHEKRLRSFELAAEALGNIPAHSDATSG
ncbi:MAG: luciferase family oxidoreductase group 1 [Caulobacteraceae bacterium]|nr:MAG: luciferase family oxidoreductase group 1 [Caulobacteraceae bacterium]